MPEAGMKDLLPEHTADGGSFEFVLQVQVLKVVRN